MVDKKDLKNKKDGYIQTIGRRKEAIARTRIQKSSSQEIIINNKELKEYFPLASSQEKVLSPLRLLDDKDKRKISVIVKGGGVSSQAEAIKLSLARALVLENEENKPLLKKEKMLSCDARTKERKKFGLKKARKAPQWKKR